MTGGTPNIYDFGGFKTEFRDNIFIVFMKHLIPFQLIFGHNFIIFVVILLGWSIIYKNEITFLTAYNIMRKPTCKSLDKQRFILSTSTNWTRSFFNHSLKDISLMLLYYRIIHLPQLLFCFSP